MHCTGLSVIRGTDDLLLRRRDPRRDRRRGGPERSSRILIRVSGPAVDSTGIGPGFSGSPVICDGRNAGAISEGLGEYGNEVALATPIEEMLRDRPPLPGRRARAATRRCSARPQPLATPLTVTGLSGRAATLVRQRGRRARTAR